MDNFTQNEVPAATPLVEKREVELIRLVSLVTQQSGALLQEEVATAGRGYYQEWGKPAVELKFPAKERTTNGLSP